MEHVLRFTYDESDNMLYLNVFLEPQGFIRRLVEGIKYILGYKCRYGHFGEWILEPSDAAKLIALLAKVKEEANGCPSSGSTGGLRDALTWNRSRPSD